MFFHRHIKSYEIKAKRFKGINATMVFLGFPDTGLEKIKALCFEKGLETGIQDKLIIISGFGGVDGFDEWKIDFISHQPIAAEPEQEYQIKNHSIRKDENELIESIRCFPIASKTPMECQQFLFLLQNRINGAL